MTLKPPNPTDPTLMEMPPRRRIHATTLRRRSTLAATTARIAVLALISAAAAGTAAAAIVYNNGAPNLFGTNMSDTIAADDFTLAGGTTVTSFRFWSIQSLASDYRGSVTWGVYTNLAGKPNALLFGGNVAATAVATGVSTGFGDPEFVFDVDVTDFHLGAGTYWLGLHNGLATTNTAVEMAWETTAVGAGFGGRYFDETFGWVGSGNEQAFRLEGSADLIGGAVPEPATLALVGLALAGGVAARRSRPSTSTAPTRHGAHHA